MTATNSEHAEAGRAASFFIFAWALGTGDYLGVTWSSTSLRETTPGIWDLVDSC